MKKLICLIVAIMLLIGYQKVDQLRATDIQELIENLKQGIFEAMPATAIDIPKNDGSTRRIYIMHDAEKLVLNA